VEERLSLVEEGRSGEGGGKKRGVEEDGVEESVKVTRVMKKMRTLGP